MSPPTPVTMVSGYLMLCCIAETPFPSQTIDEVIDEANIAYLLIGHYDGHPTDNNHHPPVRRMDARGGKKGHIQFLQVVLPQAMAFIRHHLELGMPVCIACDSGNDLSVGVTLAALQMFFDDNGCFVRRDSFRRSTIPQSECLTSFDLTNVNSC
jgi:tRNA A64-2'-O-ribosylphosphate transferase